MADHTITITASNTSTGGLTLAGPASPPINSGDTVTWIIGANSGVSSISAIDNNSTNHPNEVDVFSPDPAQVPGSTNWQGTVAVNMGGHHEYYTIGWVDTDGNPHTDDPKIDVND
jgi:hypothetical protein